MAVYTHVPAEDIDAFLARYDAGRLVSAKGIAEGPDGSRLLIQQVGRRRRIGPLPQAEDQEPTDLVVIRVSRPEPVRLRLGSTSP